MTESPWTQQTEVLMDSNTLTACLLVDRVLRTQQTLLCRVVRL